MESEFLDCRENLVDALGIAMNLSALDNAKRKVLVLAALSNKLISGLIYVHDSSENRDQSGLLVHGTNGKRYCSPSDCCSARNSGRTNR